MKKFIYCLTILILGQSCQNRKNQKEKVDLKKYSFIDSTKYRPDKKLLIGVFSNQKQKVTIDLLDNSNNELRIIQTIGPLDSEFPHIKPLFEDINHDGLSDVKAEFGYAARGSNNVCHLLIQDKSGKLIYIRGSTRIPNLEFDSLRQIITGTYFYGGTSFVDFNLGNDSLIMISGIDVSSPDGIWTVREHYTFDDHGNKIVVKKDSVNDRGRGVFSRE
jgi:hypothetical protein